MTLWGPAHPSLLAAIEEPLGNANYPCDDELTFSTTSSVGIGWVTSAPSRMLSIHNETPSPSDLGSTIRWALQSTAPPKYTTTIGAPRFMACSKLFITNTPTPSLMTKARYDHKPLCISIIWSVLLIADGISPFLLRNTPIAYQSHR